MNLARVMRPAAYSLLFFCLALLSLVLASAQSKPIPEPPRFTVDTSFNLPANQVFPTVGGVNAVTDGNAVQAAIAAAVHSNRDTAIMVPYVVGSNPVILTPTITSNCAPGHQVNDIYGCRIYVPYDAAWDGTHVIYIVSTGYTQLGVGTGTRIHAVENTATHVAVAGGIAAIQRKFTDRGGFHPGETAYLRGFTATFLNNQWVTVLSDSCEFPSGTVQIVASMLPCTVKFAWTGNDGYTATDAGSLVSHDRYYMPTITTPDASAAVEFPVSDTNLAHRPMIQLVGFRITSTSTTVYNGDPSGAGFTYILVNGTGPQEVDNRVWTSVDGSTTLTLDNAVQLLSRYSAFVKTSPTTLPNSVTQNVDVTCVNGNCNFQTSPGGTSAFIPTDAVVTPTVNSTTCDTNLHCLVNVTVPATGGGAFHMVMHSSYACANPIGVCYETAFTPDEFAWGAQVTGWAASGSDCSTQISQLHLPPGTTNQPETLCGSSTTNWTSTARIYAAWMGGGACFGTSTNWQGGSPSCVAGITSSTAHSITMPVSVNEPGFPVNGLHDVEVVYNTASPSEHDFGINILNTSEGTSYIASVSPDYLAIGGTGTFTVTAGAGTTFHTGMTSSLCDGVSYSCNLGVPGKVGWPWNGTHIVPGSFVLLDSSHYQVQISADVTAAQGASWALRSSWVGGYGGDWKDIDNPSNACTSVSRFCINTNAINVRQCVVLDGHDSFVIDSQVDECRQSTPDSQGIASIYGQTITIFNNEVEGGSENWFFGGGSKTNGALRTISDLIVQRNHPFKPLIHNSYGITLTPVGYADQGAWSATSTYHVFDSVCYPSLSNCNRFFAILAVPAGKTPNDANAAYWRPGAEWWQKDAGECKDCRRADISANIFENSPKGPLAYGFGFIPTVRTGGGHQGTPATVLDDTNVYNNLFVNVAAGISSLAEDNNCGNSAEYTCTWKGEMHRLAVKNNLILEMSTLVPGGMPVASERVPITLNGGNRNQGVIGLTDSIYEHNTLLSMPGAADNLYGGFWFDYVGGDGSGWTELTDNIWLTDNVTGGQVGGDNGPTGFTGLQHIMPTPAGTLDARFAGNYQFASRGTRYVWSPTTSLDTATPFAYVAPYTVSSDGSKLLGTGDYTLDKANYDCSSTGFNITDDGQQCGINGANLLSAISGVALGLPAGTGCTLAVQTSSLPNVQMNGSYIGTLSALCGTAPYIWSLQSGLLPGGLVLNNTLGQITGTVTATYGTYSFTVEVTDAAMNTATALLSIQVTPLSLSITTISLPPGTVGLPYNATLSGSGGTLPYNWGTVLGALPLGLVLNSTTGNITGTPSIPGTTQVHFSLQDFTGDPSTQKQLAMTFTVPSNALGSLGGTNTFGGTQSIQ